MDQLNQSINQSYESQVLQESHCNGSKEILIRTVFLLESSRIF